MPVMALGLSFCFHHLPDSYTFLRRDQATSLTQPNREQHGAKMSLSNLLACKRHLTAQRYNKTGSDDFKGLTFSHSCTYHHDRAQSWSMMEKKGMKKNKKCPINLLLWMGPLTHFTFQHLDSSSPYTHSY